MKTDPIGDPMKDVDIRTVDLDTVVDIRDIEINTDLPVPERIRDFYRQGGSLYVMKVGKTLVKTNYPDTGLTISECFERYLRTC